jgi:UDP-3-O-[3-hydroxymyristoyl] N-acetylglucosamine deacetylase
MNKFQTTISKSISFYGIGLHSGKKVVVTLEPAPADCGIIFMRTDISSADNIIKVNEKAVLDTRLSTSVFNDANIYVSTIEHLMSAVFAKKIDNLLIKIDASEVPIMDGSSKFFMWVLECAGVKYLNKQAKSLKITKEVVLEDNGSFVSIIPSDEFSIDLEIEFNHKLIGNQKFIYSNDICFETEISNARTFGFVSELEFLKSKGLALGATLDNAIGLTQDSIANASGLRYENEFVRHKMLDLIGDFYVCGFNNIKGSIKGYKTGHYINNLLLRKVFEDQNNYIVS